MADDSDSTILVIDDYVASTYVAPQVFSRVGRFVESIIVGSDSDLETPNSILAFISDDRSEQIEYIEGLVGIISFLSVLISLWFLTLLLIKCQGRDRMGCAAGYAFHDSESGSSEKEVEAKHTQKRSGPFHADMSVGAAVDPDDSVAKDDEPRESSSSQQSRRMLNFWKESATKEPYSANTYKSSVYDNQNLDEIELHTELDNIVQSVDKRGKSYSLHSIPRAVKAVKIDDEKFYFDDYSSVAKPKKARKKFWGETCCCSPRPEHVERRKFLTRAVFALFAMVSLMSCILLITEMYIPLESAAMTTSEVVQDAAAIVDELNGVLEILDEAEVGTDTMIETTPMEYETLCPGLLIENFQSQFGFNPQSMIQTISSEYQNYLPTIVDALKTAQETGDSVTGMLVDINEAVGTANKNLWVIPLIICITILIIFSQLALMLAVVFREQKFKGIETTVPQVENCYGWTILPLQIIVVLVSWLLVIVFCFGIVITTDSCMPSFGSAESGAGNMDDRGTPEDVVLAVLDQYMITTDATQSAAVESLAKERLTTYITGCNENGIESDPLAEVIILQTLLQEGIKEIGTKLSFATDVLGIDFIADNCGPGNRVRIFFTNLAVLNEKFAKVTMAIKQGYDALSCPRVNTLYVEAVHEAFCTDFATANATGLILLLMISFSGMVLITLRSSWRSAE